jgi:hypothetical protein
MTTPLYDPAEHRTLDAGPWSEHEARAAIEVIAEDTIAAYQGPERLWPNALEDLEDDPDVPYRNAYLGDIGVALLLRSCLVADGTFPFLAGACE